MTNASAPAVGSLVAFKTAPYAPFGRVTAIEDVRGDGSLIKLTTDFVQHGQTMVTYAHLVVVVAE